MGKIYWIYGKLPRNETIYIFLNIVLVTAIMAMKGQNVACLQHCKTAIFAKSNLSNVWCILLGYWQYLYRYIQYLQLNIYNL